MQKIIIHSALVILFSLVSTPPAKVNTTVSSANLSEQLCTTNFNRAVNVFKLKRGSQEIGQSLWLSRANKKAKAKYFADKKYGEKVHDRYEKWRVGRNVVAMSSGAYATGWNGSNVPAGLTIDNGELVNGSYEDKMDGLVIVEAVGGIRVSNIEDGDLTINTKRGSERIDIKDDISRSRFVDWAENVDATVFQTHLLIYENQLKINRFRSDKSKAVRKLLVLAKDKNGTLFHIIYYTKHESFTLYSISNLILNHLRSNDFNVIAALNLDTGGFDVISTGGDVKDCNGRHLTGHRNNVRKDMTNMLVYEYE